ncbi:MAG: hypothetical protein NZ602_00220 [Thermoguttaceae bacterium]|nr:hypothetical protein [Thermoguttaceae bacterium]MDW8039628.1 hypothetical protein [Thermoguttaceae bacterium]
MIRLASSQHLVEKTAYVDTNATLSAPWVVYVCPPPPGGLRRCRLKEQAKCPLYTNRKF